MNAPVSYAIGELVEASGFDRRTIVFYIQQGILPRVGRRGPNTRYPAECLTRLRFVRGVKDLQNTGRLLGASLREMRAVLEATTSERIEALVAAGLPAAEVEALFAAVQAAPPASSAPPAAPPTAPVPAPAPRSTAGTRATPPATAAPATFRPTYSAPTGERRSFGLADAGIRRRPAPGTDSAHELAKDTTGDTVRMPLPPAFDAPPSPPGVDDTHPRLPALATAAPSTSGMATPATAPVDTAELGELLRQLELKAGMSRRRAGPGASEQWTEIPVTGRVYLSVRGLAEEDTPAAEAVVRALKRALRT
jgi:DNA-binding transcriptional MerR regulator